jgi:hypothetical protein
VEPVVLVAVVVLALTEELERLIRALQVRTETPHSTGQLNFALVVAVALAVLVLMKMAVQVKLHRLPELA